MKRLDEVQTSEQEQILDGVVSVREVLAYLEQDRYFNLAGASNYLSMSKSAIRHRKDIPKYSINKKLLLFRKSELDGWLSRFKKGGGSEEEELDKLVDGAVVSVIGE